MKPVASLTFAALFAGLAATASPILVPESEELTGSVILPPPMPIYRVLPDPEPRPMPIYRVLPDPKLPPMPISRVITVPDLPPMCITCPTEP